MISYIESLSNLEIAFLIIGFTGQGLFASRFIVQWIYSEINKKSIDKYNQQSQFDSVGSFIYNFVCNFYN